MLETSNDAGAPAPFISKTASSDETNLLYVGNSRGLERMLVPRSGMQPYFFPMAPPSTLRGLTLILLASLRSLAVIARTRPAVTFATGGYVSVPAVLASWILRVPVVLFLPDMVPGKAVAWLTPLARKIAVTSEDAARFLPRGKTQVTGYPVRDFFRTAQRAASRDHFGLSGDEPVLCVFGGSLGSRSINQALARWLPSLLERCQVIHICGQERYAEATEAAAQLTPSQREKYRLLPFLHGSEMAMALAASNLVLCRSGASTLGELPAAGVPAILVPLPASGVHQRENASYLANRGAAVIVNDEDLAEGLGTTVMSLLDDRRRLLSMAKACQALDRPDAGEHIASLVLAAAA